MYLRKQFKRLFRRLELMCDSVLMKNEYAYKCLFSTNYLFLYMAKICVFDNYGLQKHWGAEMSNVLNPLMRIKVKNDNRKQELKRKLITENIITDFFGDNYEEYGYDFLRFDYVEAIESEGCNIKDFNIKDIVNRNRQCYINYFEKLKKINFKDYKNELWNMSNEFINDVRAAYANE